MLALDNITKTFRTDEVETAALGGISINIADGEYVAIMGPSGCGKSTLLNLLGLLDTPSDGKYEFLGEDVSNAKERHLANIRKENIGFIFQSFNLIDELNVRENVELPLLYQGMGAAERRARVEEVTERVGIAHRHKHMPQQLSGGQQQRVAVARAIVSKPALVLADEPTGNLDSENGAEVMNLIQDLNDNGTTVVMVTHSETQAQEADRIINLFDGRVVVEDQQKDFAAG